MLIDTVKCSHKKLHEGWRKFLYTHIQTHKHAHAYICPRVYMQRFAI